ncbi:uncharacterized protein LOC127866901 isoform X2 [Dreissena polymorpha]|nr:uncharacterized protein LOC127866901 isoform X2 [Dreissena polymorpha]XP_052263713.1 uncharacterized protein LOC127866901 isoform X2 [Dreissena polymorpha]
MLSNTASCIIYVAACCHAVQGMLIRCTGNTRYLLSSRMGEWDSGTCEACPRCDGGGFVYNRTLPRQKDPIYGFTSCYPCVPCPIGQYREAGSFPVCNQCVKSCAAVNRFESRPCGGSSPGYCGECFDGYVALANAAEGECLKTPETTQRSTDKSLPEAATYQSPPVPSEGATSHWVSIDTTAVEINARAEASINIDGGTVVGSLAASIFMCVLVVVGMKCIRKRSQSGRGPTTGTSASEENTAFIQTAPVSKATLNTSRYSLSNQVEVDAVPDVRREAPELVTGSQLEALLQLAHRRTYPSHVLTLDDPFTKQCITHIATNIGGEANRRDVFRALNIIPAVYEPEEEKWLRDKHNYPDFIYTVLQSWLVQNTGTKVADLAHLCRCLERSNLTVISDALTSMHFAQATRSQAAGSASSERGQMDTASKASYLDPSV